MLIVTAGAGITAGIILLCIESFRLWRRQRCAAYVVIALASILLFVVHELSYVLLEALS
jgi:uncharacterized membrane protein (DUF2068 family)